MSVFLLRLLANPVVPIFIPNCDSILNVRTLIDRFELDFPESKSNHHDGINNLCNKILSKN